MVIAAAQGEVLLGPDDLSARLQPAAGQIGGDNRAVQRPVPDISDIPGEQRISLSPVSAIVVEHLSLRELAAAKRTARPPARFIADPVWGIGHHQMRLSSGQHLRDIGRVGAVAAANAVVSQQPDVAGPSDRLLEDLRDAVGIRQTARSQTRQDGFKLIRLEPDQAEIDTAKPELLKLMP